jgi:hypothetical protein
MEISRPSKKKLENLGHGAGNIYYATSSNTTIDSDNYDSGSDCNSIDYASTSGNFAIPQITN